jgi:hypothetical protein
MYVVQGDEVVLLDRQGENEDWFLVQLSLSRFMVYCASNERRRPYG